MKICTTIEILGWVREAIINAKQQERNLDMTTEHSTSHECNTICCVFEWAALHPKFKRIGVTNDSVRGISSKESTEARRKGVFDYISLGEDLIGLYYDEVLALGACVCRCRREAAECAKLDCDLSHFNKDDPNYDDVIEVIDILIQRYKDKSSWW